MSRKKTSVLTLVINAIPQGYIETVVAATLCSNFIHVTYREVGGGGWQPHMGSIHNTTASTQSILRASHAIYIPAPHTP